MDKEINIYVASSCKNNGTVNARGSISICVNDDTNNLVTEIIQDSSITNQKLDLLAIKLAIDKFKDNKIINIYSRSQYAVKCVTEWGQKWKANNWSNISKKGIKNLSLIKDILSNVDSIENSGAYVNIIHLSQSTNNNQTVAAYNAASSIL